MDISSTPALVLVLCALLSAGRAAYGAEARLAHPPPAPYAGSASCRECHERFYGLWSTSFHGLALRPYTAELGQERLAPQKEALVVGGKRYRAEVGEGEGYVLETDEEGKSSKYRIAYALGGKNVFYFLTPLDRGRLQTLPVAYDVRRKEWFDTALSGLRHFPGERTSEEPVGWREWPYTFNTACYGCHVSQLSTNYDPKSDSYHTAWREPGINCETCHGPSEGHNAAMRSLPKGEKPADAEFRIIRTKTFTAAQHNDACSFCHSKAIPLTAGYRPGERFFDHFDLVTLESPDFYPDGRDLGENYTQTSWRLSPCVREGKLSCIACHTSSGRYRFRDPEDADKVCLPCHARRVKDSADHTRHRAGSEASRCVSCHMPTTEFARMRRTDHSMLPPTPGTTLAYGSPNACNGCHADRDSGWADRTVRAWRSRDYQAPVLKRAALVDSARRRDWSKLPEVLAYLDDPKRDEIFAASLVRLLASCEDRRKAASLRKALGDPSPLVRAAAVEVLGRTPTPEILGHLVRAAGDDYRLVRIRAAAALAQVSAAFLPKEAAGHVRKATDEYLESLTVRLDSWDAHYNLGNYLLGQDRPKEATAEYEEALKREPRAVPALVNAALALARLGDAAAAEQRLRSALAVAPESAPVRYNLGLLKAEQGNRPAAEEHLKEAFRLDQNLAGAAYNLCIITGDDRPAEALPWCRKAADLKADNPRYAYTLAWYQARQGDEADARTTLETLLGRHPTYAEGYVALGDLFERAGRRDDALRLYDRGVSAEGMPVEDRVRLQLRHEALQASGAPGR